MLPPLPWTTRLWNSVKKNRFPLNKLECYETLSIYLNSFKVCINSEYASTFRNTRFWPSNVTVKYFTLRKRNKTRFAIKSDSNNQFSNQTQINGQQNFRNRSTSLMNLEPGAYIRADRNSV